MMNRTDRTDRTDPSDHRISSVVSQLTKLPIVTLSTLSAVTGYLVMRRSFDSGAVTLCLGVLQVGMGTCALNQVQDRRIDALMERTRRRPIPSGAIRPGRALALAVLLLIGGFLVLWRFHNLMAALIALSAAAWYNGVYTYVKRRSAFAVVPGALVGALPPAIGWTAAGGVPSDPRLLALCFVFFIWQVPHFWLLLFLFGDEYAGAGLPSLTSTFRVRQLVGFSFIWMLVTSVSALLLPVYGLTSSSWAPLALAACALWLAWTASNVLASGGEGARTRPAFRTINLYVLLVMALLVADALL
jgi:protoheme IX farnesyltransferase